MLRYFRRCKLVHGVGGVALFIFLLSASPLGSCAPENAESAIVDTEYVNAAMKRHAIIWDTRSAAEYQQDHLPGAVNIDNIGEVLRDENSEDYLPLEKLEKILGNAGIDPAKEIIAYGAKANPYVYFGLVTLQYLGGNNPKIYHGGIDDWKAAGQPTSTTPAKLTPVTLKLTIKPGMIVDTAEVVRSLHNPKIQIVDARRPTEYDGEEINALRGGHIPGAIPVHFMENWADPDTLTKLSKKLVKNKDGMNLKSHEQLKALYAKLDPEKETIVYCQSGIRASETATVLKEIGFKDVKIYDSSWLGYGNTLDAPAENVNFFNVGLLQGKIRSMQKRIEALEKQLAESKTAK